MAITAWSMVRFVHVIAAMMWVGGQLTLSGVVLPAVRAELRPELRGPVVVRTARRFAALANFVILPTLIVSGVALAWHRGVTLSPAPGPDLPLSRRNSIDRRPWSASLSRWNAATERGTPAISAASSLLTD